MEILIVLAVAAAAIALIAAPLWPGRGAGVEAESPDLAELEAAKEAKIREIREAELDHRLGKISDEDWRALDAALREEAAGLLRELESLRTDGGRGDPGKLDLTPPE